MTQETKTRDAELNTLLRTSDETIDAGREIDMMFEAMLLERRAAVYNMDRVAGSREGGEWTKDTEPGYRTDYLGYDERHGLDGATDEETEMFSPVDVVGRLSSADWQGKVSEIHLVYSYPSPSHELPSSSPPSHSRSDTAQGVGERTWRVRHLYGGQRRRGR